jgi:hypothetical protein
VPGRSGRWGSLLLRRWQANFSRAGRHKANAVLNDLKGGTVHAHADANLVLVNGIAVSGVNTEFVGGREVPPFTEYFLAVDKNGVLVVQHVVMDFQEVFIHAEC